MEISNGPLLYVVGEKVASAKAYRLFLCKQGESGRQCLLQIASEEEYNGELDRNAYILKELERLAQKLEKEYAEVKKDPKDMLNYHLSFPKLVDSFICPEQGGRRVNILAFRSVEDVSSMVPLIKITAKDKLRVDLRTSAWIMGKLLKLLVFTHSNGISVGSVSGANIIIEPDQHYVLIFNWSLAETYPEAVPEEIQNQEIAQAAQAVITVLGGDSETGIFPNDGEEGFDQYTEHVWRLAGGSARSAERAHANFYELIDSLWKREYHKFATKPLFF